MMRCKKKIGIVLSSDAYSGGIIQYSQSILDALQNDDLNEYIIFLNKDDSHLRKVDLEVRNISGYKHSTIKKTVNFLQLLMGSRKPIFISKKELKIYDDIDLFLVPTVTAYPHFYLGKPFIFSLHDMQEQYLNEFFSRKEKFLRWIIGKNLTKHAEKIICESEFVKSDIVNFYQADVNKVRVITAPPPAEMLNFRWDALKAASVKLRYSLPNRFIFYPAQTWFHKNHIRLISAFKLVVDKFPEIHLILTGSKKENHPAIIKHIRDMGLEDRIKHLGFLDYSDLPYIYKFSEFLVMPTLFESVSIPIYEAFALQVAVCSSNVVALPEQVGDAALLFDPNNILDIAQKMCWIIEDSNLRAELATKGYKKINNFNHENYKNKLVELL